VHRGGDEHRGARGGVRFAVVASLPLADTPLAASPLAVPAPGAGGLAAAPGDPGGGRAE
jgi:hypothetical protein